jgi:hypothetical protein
MPIPIPVPAGHGHRFRPYYVRDRQPWAVQQERQRHTQAMFTVGEYAMFALMWHLQDFQNGLVARCPRCYSQSPDSRQEKIAKVYQQPIQNKCPVCFGTTFDGGFKALIVRPTIFSDTDESEILKDRGIVHPDDVQVESTVDFRVRQNDYVFRASGDRWQLRVPQRVTLRTGFDPPLQSQSAITYNHASAQLEDPVASVAYKIGPNKAMLRSILSRHSRYPIDFSQYEIIRSSLIPAGE